MSIPSASASRDRGEFVYRTLIVLSLVIVAVVLVLTLWYARRVFLAAFAGILLAVLLETLATGVGRVLRLSYGWSLVLVIFALTALLAVMAWLIGAQVAQQFGQLLEALPTSLEQVRQQLGKSAWGAWLVPYVPEAAKTIDVPQVVYQVAGIAGGVLQAMVDFVVIMFVGIYGAAQPDWYLRGFLHLVPPTKRDRAREVFERVGYTLRWWLLGQSAAMLFVGIFTGVGLWLLGAPLPLALGLLAFILEIIPNLGPILAAIPAILLAWAQGPWLALYVLLLYVVVQMIESYILMPLVQLHAIRLPPALQILAVFLLGLFGGFLGLLLAAPLVISTIIFVRSLYVEDVLGDRTATPEEG